MQHEKLLSKLIALKISKKELESLLLSLGFTKRQGKGSHEKWILTSCPPIILASHNKEIKPYQLKQVLKVLQMADLLSKGVVENEKN